MEYFIGKMAIKNYKQLVSQLNKATERAVKNTCNRLLGKLQELVISEYYDAFSPIEYSRSMEFYRSAMTEMVSSSCGKIFMNDSYGQYPFNNRGWAWTMAQNIELGNQGIHGGYATDESLRHHYWDSFEDYCDKNALNILREELIKQEITLK